MEEVKKKYEQITRAVDTLGSAIEDFQKKEFFGVNPDQVERFSVYLQDAMIKRFEYSTDLIWKYVRIYLMDVHGVPIDSATPRDIFRHALNVGVLSEGDVLNALEMVKMRNHTSHIYKQEIADFVALQAPRFYTLMRVILSKTKP